MPNPERVDQLMNELKPFMLDTGDEWIETAEDLWNTCRHIYSYVDEEDWWAVYGVLKRFCWAFARNPGGPDPKATVEEMRDRVKRQAAGEELPNPRPRVIDYW